MNKIILSIIFIGTIIALLFLFSGKNNIKDQTENGQNIEIKDGIQYITVNALGGYSPRISNAQANIPTKLIVKTNNTYDCSLALVIRSLNYQKILPQNGEEIIDIGTKQAGEKIQGTCSMGMYNFAIQFN